MVNSVASGTVTAPAGRLMGLVVAALVLLAAPSAFAQRSGERAHLAEFGGMLSEVQGVRVVGTHGTSLDVHGDTAWGIVGGYNFTDHFALGGEITSADPKYVATRTTDTGAVIDRVSARLSVDSFLVKGTFNILKGPVTPYVEIGAGWVRLDSNIVSGPPQTGCWWDPWWGYICSSFYDTYSDTRTAVRYGVGVRWDINGGLALRGGWGHTDLHTNYASANQNNTNFRVEAAWKF